MKSANGGSGKGIVLIIPKGPIKLTQGTFSVHLGSVTVSGHVFVPSDGNSDMGKCKNCGSEVNWKDITEARLAAETGVQIGWSFHPCKGVPAAAFKPPACKACDVQLDLQGMDAYYGRDPEVAKICAKCRRARGLT